jgi:hypothetical protein
MMDAAEALTNAAVGLLVSWAATYWLLPLWGLHTSPAGAAGITAMFFALSFARAYVLRRLFRRFA